MENEENITISINRGGFPTLVDVENYIRATIERYVTELGGLFIQPYSSVNYNRGTWSASISFTNRDPALHNNDEPDFGW